MRSGIQNWRAVAITADGTTHHLFLGSSQTEVRNGYNEAFGDVLTEDEQRSISRIEVHRWNGTPDRGRWEFRGGLTIPQVSNYQAVLKALATTP